MQAIISSGGKQFKVGKGSKINVEKLNLNVGDKIIFDKVLAIIAENSNVIGKPHIEGASVDGKIIEQYRGEKVTIIKFKRLIAIPKVIIITKLKFFSSTPCNVTKIFQIETKENKNIEEINE